MESLYILIGLAIFFYLIYFWLKTENENNKKYNKLSPASNKIATKEINLIEKEYEAKRKTRSTIKIIIVIILILFSLSQITQ